MKSSMQIQEATKIKSNTQEGRSAMWGRRVPMVAAVASIGLALPVAAWRVLTDADVADA